MPLAVGLGGEGEVADVTSEGPLAVVSPHVPDQGALVRARVAAHVTLVGRQTHVDSSVTCTGKETGQ